MGRRSTRSPVGVPTVPPRASAKRAVLPSRAWRSILLAGLVTTLLPSLATGESEGPVKAAFLFNFARYVEWPPAAFEGESSPIRLCVMGASAFDEVVSATVSGRSVGLRPVAVEKVASLEEAAGCHLLFLEAGVEVPGPVVAERLGGVAVFTISDQPGFAAAGGVANFILVDQKIRFEINPSAARRAGLKISSSLLRLAKRVGEDDR